MTTIRFDTLKFVETLTTAGMPFPQAKALCENFAEMLAAYLATKSEAST